MKLTPPSITAAKVVDTVGTRSNGVSYSQAPNKKAAIAMKKVKTEPKPRFKKPKPKTEPTGKNRPNNRKPT